MEEKKARFVGIDLGKRSMEVRIIDEATHAVKAWNGKTDATGRTRLYKQLQAGDLIALEACSLAFIMAREIIDKTEAKPLVLNPSKLTIIYQSLKKTDSEDALKLARLIQRIPQEELPLVSLPSEEEMKMRAVVQEKRYYSDQRVRFVNRLHSIFVRHGITTVKKSDLKLEKKREKTLEMLANNAMLLMEARRCVAAISLFEQHLAVLAEKQSILLQKNELTPHVISMPGVGMDTAMAFLAYIGDGSRFSRAAEVSNYIGLVPRVDISGDTIHYGRIIKKHGCTSIRRVLINAAWALVRSSMGGALVQKYNELRDRKGSKKAIVAIARRMGELLWLLVTRRKFYRDVSSEYLTKKLMFYKLDKTFSEGRALA